MVLLLTACQAGPRTAPVVERVIVAKEPSLASKSGLNAKQTDPATPAQAAKKSTMRKGAAADWRPEGYVVKKGDTLIAIALDHGLDYRELAGWNNLGDPNRILIGQKLNLRAPQNSQFANADTEPVAVVARPLNERTLPAGEPLPEAVAIKNDFALEKSAKADEVPAAVEGNAPAKVGSRPPIAAVASEKNSAFDVTKWLWPAQGDVTAYFDGSRSKGVVIAGKQGDPVLASNAGKVVYVGKAIKTYGQLVIVKHSDEYLSVYAHNAAILVKEGQRVASGQKIAEMGSRSPDQIALHFEIRKLGQPVDPTKYLPTR